MRTVTINEHDFELLHMVVRESEWDRLLSASPLPVFDTKTGELIFIHEDENLRTASKQRMRAIERWIEPYDKDMGICWWKNLKPHIKRKRPARHVEVPCTTHRRQHELLVEFVRGELEEGDLSHLSPDEKEYLTGLAGVHIGETLDKLEKAGYDRHVLDNIQHGESRDFLRNWLDRLGRERGIRYIVPEP